MKNVMAAKGWNNFLVVTFIEMMQLLQMSFKKVRPLPYLTSPYLTFNFHFMLNLFFYINNVFFTIFQQPNPTNCPSAANLLFRFATPPGATASSGIVVGI